MHPGWRLTMPRGNRVDPFGDLHATADRGLFTGNRGCLVDARGRVVRHHRGDLWITCVTRLGTRRVGLARPNRWTPIFFLDDAVALAAGHRPCGYCRTEDYRSYRNAVGAGLDRDRPPTAPELNRLLAAERLVPGRGRRGLERRDDRIPWEAPVDELPDGTVLVLDGDAHLLLGGSVRPFAFAGWGPPAAAPSGTVTVLTPPTSVRALAHGFVPTLAL